MHVSTQHSRRRFLQASGSAALTLWWVDAAGAADQAIAVIANKGIPAKDVTAAGLEAVFRGSVRRWSDGQTVLPLNFPAGHPVRVIFDRAVLQMSPDQAARFWIDQRIRGVAQPPRQIDIPTLVPRAVLRIPGAISYVPLALIDATVRVAATIRDGKLVMTTG